MNNDVSGPGLPLIAKYTFADYKGIQPVSLSRSAIGYVVRGKKRIYYGDRSYEVAQGELFYLNIGTHYIENIPDGWRPFEQFLFYYSAEMIGEILDLLSQTYGMDIANAHKCRKCSGTVHAVSPAWGPVKAFFNSTDQLLKEEPFPGRNEVERLKMAELICMIVSKKDCCIASKILTNITPTAESFERYVHKHIFSDIMIDEMAENCGMSLSSFKRIFRNHFYESPHKWILRQRLMQARMLIISSDRTVVDIGMECRFNNPSHFIRLFKREFGHTPAAYRKKSLQDGEPKLPPGQKKQKVHSGQF